MEQGRLFMMSEGEPGKDCCLASGKVDTKMGERQKGDGASHEGTLDEVDGNQ